MENLIAFTILVVISTTLAASTGYGPATLPIPCGSSRDCGDGHCCRDGKNLVDPRGWPSEWGDPLFGGLVGGNRGICSSTRGQRGETCDFGCQCGRGLLCYRPLTGVCCAPSTCQPEDFVKEKEEYWRNCFNNPKCRLPVRK